MRDKTRAKVACRVCNARRIKCDRNNSDCCSTCQAAGVPCELIESRRGRYVRVHRKDNLYKSPRLPVIQGPRSKEPPGTQVSGPVSSHHNPKDVSSDSNRNQEVSIPIDRASPNNDPEDGAEMLFARMADTPRPSQTTGLRRSRIVYLGESYNLTYVVNEVCQSSDRTNRQLGPIIHYPVPDNMHDKPLNLPRDMRIEREEMSSLTRYGAFEKPPKHVSDQLVQAYFECVYPAYPIFNRDEFVTLYNNDSLPLLTLQSVYLLGATYCDESVIQDAGFESRYMARHCFYKRAKALYDTDFERNTTTMIQALFLLGFWCGSPFDQKDTWHWLGIAVSLAMSTGMHRSTSNSNMSSTHKAIWKKIWWCLYIRDVHAAAALGRPPHIQQNFCDIELPEERDFPGPQAYDRFPGQSREHILYFMHMSRLCVRMMDILNAKFLPRSLNIKVNLSALTESMYSWERALPPELQYSGFENARGPAFWANMVHIIYNNYLILLHRPSSDNFPPVLANIGSDNVALDAASRITRMVEDLLTAGMLDHAQINIISSLFAALSILVLYMQRSDQITRELAEHRARLCMLALQKSQEQWPVSGWTLELFVRIIKALDHRSANQGNHATTKSADLMRDPERSNNLTNRTDYGTMRDHRDDALEDASGLAVPIRTGPIEQNDSEGGGGMTFFQDMPMTDQYLPGFNIFQSSYEADDQFGFPFIDDVIQQTWGL